MYDFVDRPVTSLDGGGRFLIWSMRSWVAALGQRECPAARLAPAFARWRMIGGLQPFHQAMLLLNRDALEPLRFCALPCNHVSEDEAILLALVGQLGGGKTLAARDTLALLIDESSLGDALARFADLAGVLAPLSLLPAPPDAISRGQA